MVDENVQPVSQQAVEVKAEGSAESGDIVRGESASASDEIEEVELPMEADLPGGWDWDHLPDSQERKQTTGTEPSETESTPESEEDKGEPEGQSGGDDSSEGQGESEQESASEKSGEDASSEQGEPEEQSSEEGSTEETEPETTTLSPEEQASIVESATAQIELPPIYFD